MPRINKSDVIKETKIMFSGKKKSSNNPFIINGQIVCSSM
jgi:hypothetical protein